MVVKMQTETGYEYWDDVKKVKTGGTMGYYGEQMAARHVNVMKGPPANEGDIPSGDKGPYTLFEMEFRLKAPGLNDAFLSGPIETNGDVFILNDNGKTIDRF